MNTPSEILRDRPAVQLVVGTTGVLMALIDQPDRAHTYAKRHRAVVIDLPITTDYRKDPA